MFDHHMVKRGLRTRSSFGQQERPANRPFVIDHSVQGQAQVTQHTTLMRPTAKALISWTNRVMIDNSVKRGAHLTQRTIVMRKAGGKGAD